jgi:hypothetical protein
MTSYVPAAQASFLAETVLVICLRIAASYSYYLESLLQIMNIKVN